MATWNLGLAEYCFLMFASSVYEVLSHLPEEVDFPHRLPVQILEGNPLCINLPGSICL